MKSLPSKVFVLANGLLMCDKANLVALPNLGTKDNPNKPSEWVESPVFAVLIEHPDGIVLFDTGCNPNAMNERWEAECIQRTPYFAEEKDSLLNTLKRLGYTPDDINTVIVSHLHEDHAGCLEYFTKSKIFVCDVELAQTMKLFAIRQSAGAYIFKDIEAWLKSKLNWCLIENNQFEYEVLPGVKILNLGPGHTFGMLGLQVDLPNTGTIILPSDAIYSPENIGPPIRYPGLAWDTRGYYNTIKRIVDLQRKTNAQIWYSHDAEFYKTLKKSDEGYYD